MFVLAFYLNITSFLELLDYVCAYRRLWIIRHSRDCQRGECVLRSLAFFTNRVGLFIIQFCVCVLNAMSIYTYRFLLFFEVI